MKTWYTAVSFAGLLSTAYTGHNTYDDDDDDGPGHCGGWKCKKCEGSETARDASSFDIVPGCEYQSSINHQNMCYDGECSDDSDCKGSLACSESSVGGGMLIPGCSATETRRVCYNKNKFLRSGPTSESHCSGHGTVSETYGCNCWSSSMGLGAKCDEFSDEKTCNGLGKVDSDGSCMCWTESTGPTCIEFTPEKTCSSRGTPTMDGACNCWDSAKGFGPTCSEYTDATTCSGNGKAQPDGSCVCFGSTTGIGPSCSEYTDASFCNGKGTVSVNSISDTTAANTTTMPAVCTCWDSAKGEGPTCSEFTNGKTCNGKGKVLSSGRCLCDDPDVGT
eukprot:gene3705-1008_t